MTDFQMWERTLANLCKFLTLMFSILPHDIVVGKRYHLFKVLFINLM